MPSEIKFWACIVIGAAAGIAAVTVHGLDQVRFVAFSVSLSSAMMLTLITLSILLGCGAPRRR